MTKYEWNNQLINQSMKTKYMKQRQLTPEVNIGVEHGCVGRVAGPAGGRKESSKFPFYTELSRQCVL